MGQLRRFQPYHLHFDAGDHGNRGGGIVPCDPGPDVVEIVDRGGIEGGPSCARPRAPEHLGGRDRRTRHGETPAHLGGLPVGETQAAVVLLLHAGDDLRHVGLPFGRPRRHAVEELLDLIFRHGGILAATVGQTIRGAVGDVRGARS
jgi:hypothetical protein